MKLLAIVCKTILVVTFIVIMASCSSSSKDDGGTSGGDDGTQSGVFIDSVVEGVDYNCSESGLSGTTDAEGKYSYKVDDTCTFSVGDIVLGTTAAKGVVTPLDLISQYTYEELVNRLIFLQELDSNHDLDNGIQIPEGLSGTLGVEFSDDIGTFMSALAIWLYPSGFGIILTTEESALAHFYASTDPYFQAVLTETMFNDKMATFGNSSQFITKSDATYELVLTQESLLEVCTGSWNIDATKLMLTQEKCGGVDDPKVIELNFQNTPAAAVYFRVKSGSSEPYDYSYAKIDTMGDAVVPSLAPTVVENTLIPPTSSSIAVTWNNVPTATRYALVYNKTGDFSGFQLAHFYDINTFSVNITGLDKGTTYYFQMRARNTVGYSTVSNVYSETTLQTIPAPPSNLYRFESPTFHWDDNSDNEENFVLQLCDFAECSTNETFETVAADTTAYDVPIAPGSTIYARVKAVNSIGDSAYSNQFEYTRP